MTAAPVPRAGDRFRRHCDSSWLLVFRGVAFISTELARLFLAIFFVLFVLLLVLGYR